MWLTGALFLNATFVSGMLFVYAYAGNMGQAMPFWCALSIPYVLASRFVAAQSPKAAKTFYVDDLD